MKSKFTSVIISFVILGIISVLFIFGIILWNEAKIKLTCIEPENFKPDTSLIFNDTNEDEDIDTPNIIESNKLNNVQSANSNNNSNQIIDYDDISVDKYFYDQLNDYSKTIYRAFESNKEKMKTGTHEISFGNTFSSLLNTENGQSLLGEYYQSAIEAYMYDNPDVFYLSPNKMYLNVETHTKGNSKTYNVYINSGNEANYFNDEYISKEQVDLAISEIETIRNDILRNITGDTYEDVKMIHDYIINNIEYDTSVSKDNIYNIYGALVNKVAVCEGYARAFKYLLDYCEIPCTLVIGKGTNSEGETENHAWNYVKINNNWFAVDTTWDDPIIIGGGLISKSSKYKYFLKGSQDFNEDHIPSEQFTAGGKEFKYPELSIYNY